MAAFSRLTALGAGFALLATFGCATLPDPKFKAYDFPEGDVYVDRKPTRKYKALGPVRVRVNFDSLNPDRDEQELCRNAWNKGAGDLLKRARRDRKGDAVIDVHSVTYYIDGKSKTHSSAECSDDGQEGQILMEGTAIRWVPEPKPGTREEG
jgi:hypothetical protein